MAIPTSSWLLLCLLAVGGSTTGVQGFQHVALPARTMPVMLPSVSNKKMQTQKKTWTDIVSSRRRGTLVMAILEEDQEACDDERSNHDRVSNSLSGQERQQTKNSSHNLLNNNTKETEWYNQAEYKNKRNLKRQWLTRTTDALIHTTPGTLVKGKWHELVSMLYGWSAFIKTDADAPLRMEAILKRLYEEQRAGNNDEVVVDIDMYNRLLDAWACAALFQKNNRSRPPTVASQRAREILVLLQETYEAQMQDAVVEDEDEDDEDNLVQQAQLLMPNEESFNLVLHAVCKTEGPTIARRLLAFMEYLHRSGKNPLAKPSRTDYTSVLHAYTQLHRFRPSPRPHPKERQQHRQQQPYTENAGALAEGFLRHMNITAGITPDTYCYNLAIKAWAHGKRGREAAEHADRILEEMQAPKDIVTYASVISAWAQSGMRAHAVQRAEELLRQIESDPRLEPNTVVLNAVMSAWVKSRSPGASNRTGELLREMELAEDPQIRPDLIAYNTHLHALSLQAKKPGMAQRADALLQKMEDLYERGDVGFAPNLFSYNLVIEAWSNSPSTDAAMRAAHVLRKLAKVANNDKRPGVEPDTFSFNQVLAALSRSPMNGAAKMAEDLLNYMEKAYRTGIHPNAKPDAMGYTSVIQAHARSGDPGAAVKAERLLGYMKERYFVHNEANLKPNRNVYNAVIHCWARSGQGTLGARKAEAILREMEELREKYKDEYMAPNLVTFNCLLNAWALSGTRCCGLKAERILNQMLDNGLVKPNDLTYNTVINAISKSKNEAKAQRALRILRRMDKLYQAGVNKEARPNEVTYTAVLKSCAFPAVPDERTRRKALDTAIFTLEELIASRYGHPNQITYGTFFKACANLVDDEELRRAVIKEVFHQCCKDGQVGEMVLTQLRAAAPDLFHELVVNVAESNPSRRKGVKARVTLADLPPEWYSNVRTQKTRGKQQAAPRWPRSQQRKPSR